MRRRLSEFHPGNPELFRSDTLWPYFERLRNEEPVHFCTTSPVGTYWSVTKYNDIMHVDTNRGHLLVGRRARRHHAARPRPRIQVAELHRHGRAAAWRAAQERCTDVRARQHSTELAASIREALGRRCSTTCRATRRFNWVDRVSIELTTQMLADAVRFSLGGSAQADALVRRRHRTAEERRVREPRTALRPSSTNAATISRGCGTSASNARADAAISSR